MDASLTIPRRSETIRAFKEQGGLVAAVFPIHYPRALLRAFNILPVEVWGPPAVADTSYGDAHLQPYVCSIVRNALSFLQSGGLDVADVLVVPHTCDSFQGFASILLDFVKPRQPVFPIYIPRGTRASDVDFYANELRALCGKLAEFTGRKPSDKELQGCIRREEIADDLLAQLHQARQNLPLPNLDFYRMLRSREYLPAEQFTELARQILAHKGESSPNGTPIILSGIVPEPMQVLQSISDMEGLIVADDLACCGRRLYPSGGGGDPFRRLAERVVHAPPDSTRSTPIQARLDHLVNLVRGTGAKGVVFYTVKFCEPELFDLPILRDGLHAQGIPSVIVEMDLNDPLPHQTLTRIEAFLEVLQ